MQNKSTKLWIVIGIIVVIVVAWIVGFSGKESGQEVIKIGAVVSLTGPGSFYGGNIRKGIDLAVDEINNTGGINGRLVAMIYEDDKTDSKETITAVQKLTSIDKVVAIIGPQWDFLVNAAIPIADEKRIVMISPAAPFDSLLEENQQSQYFFTTFPSASSSMESVETFLIRESAKTAVIVAVNNGWGTAHVNAYQEAAYNVGTEVLEVFRLAQTDNNNLRTELTRIKQINPNAILVVLNDADNINFVRRYRELGMHAKVLAHENFSDPLYTERLAREDALNFYFFEFPDPQERFVEKFTSFYGEMPQIAADTAYDAVYILKDAIKRGGVNPQEIARTMRETKNFVGASGPIDFTESNYPEDKKALLKQVTINGFETIE